MMSDSSVADAEPDDLVGLTALDRADAGGRPAAATSPTDLAIAAATDTSGR